jgi:hypothetical protein
VKNIEPDAGRWLRSISVISFLTAILLVILGIGVVLGGGMFDILLHGALYRQGSGSSGWTGALFILLGLFIIFIGLVEFFIARALWQQKKWARNITLVFSCVMLVLGLVWLFTAPVLGFFVLIIYGSIVYLLAFSKAVTGLFKL